MCSPLPEYFWSCTSHRGRRNRMLCCDVCIPWLFVAAAHDTLAHDAEDILSSEHIGNANANARWITADFTLLFYHVLNRAALNNANPRFKSNLNVKCFITAWVEMTFGGGNNIQYVRPKCQITLTLQPFIPKLLGCNFALKFDTHHHVAVASLRRAEMKNVIHLPEEKYAVPRV